MLAEAKDLGFKQKKKKIECIDAGNCWNICINLSA